MRKIALFVSVLVLSCGGKAFAQTACPPYNPRITRDGGMIVRGSPKDRNNCISSWSGVPAKGYAVVFPIPHGMTPRILKGTDGNANPDNLDCMERIDRLDMRRRIECLSDVDVMLNNEDLCNRHKLLIGQLTEYLDRHEKPTTMNRSDVMGVRDILADYEKNKDVVCGKKKRSASEPDDPTLSFVNIDIEIQDGDYNPDPIIEPKVQSKEETPDVFNPPAKGPDGYVDDKPIVPSQKKEPEEYKDVQATKKAYENKLKEDKIVDKGHEAYDDNPEGLAALSCSENVCKTKLEDKSSDTLTTVQNKSFTVIDNRNSTLESRLDAICNLKCVAVTDRMREEKIVGKLSDYVRRRVPWYIPEPGEKGPPIKPLRPDVQAAMFVIAGADRAPVSEKIDLRGTDLRGANLKHSNLTDIDFAGTNLSAVDLGNASGVDGWENIYLITIDETTRIPDSIYAGFTPIKTPYVPPQPTGSFNIVTSDWIWWQAVPVERNMTPIPARSDLPPVPTPSVGIEEFELIVPQKSQPSKRTNQESPVLIDDKPASLLPIRKEEIK